MIARFWKKYFKRALDNLAHVKLIDTCIVFVGILSATLTFLSFFLYTFLKNLATSFRFVPYEISNLLQKMQDANCIEFNSDPLFFSFYESVICRKCNISHYICYQDN